MARSLALWFYLLLAGRGQALATAPERPARPPGDVLWLHAGRATQPESLRQILRLLARERPDVTLLVTHGAGAAPDPGVDILTEPCPPEQLPAIRAFLDHWRPDAGLFVGLNLPAALIAEAHKRAVPLVLADADAGAEGAAFWRRGMVGSILGRFSRIFARDAGSLAALRTLGGRALAVELAGRIEEEAEPLPCNEAEREDLAERLRARPVWLAAGCPEAEERAVLDAHVHALSHAHRLLLILAPAQADRAQAIADACAAEGLVAARRAEEEELDADVQVLIADGMEELGLWYRLAPVTYLGGTIAGPGPVRSPLEPAALGSALVHGPQAGSYAEALGRLADARAARRVQDRDELRAAIADLIAPDKAAILAHNAWVVTSGGTEVAERLVAAVFQAMDNTPVARIAP